MKKSLKERNTMWYR